MQEHIFPDFSLSTLKFPDFSQFSRWVATLRRCALCRASTSREIRIGLELRVVN